MAATGAKADDISKLMKGGDAETASDFANYFCSYAFLYHQKQMLTDHARMHAYHSAVMDNAELFKDKVVVDVGTGSGVLALWAAKAGAKKVYAVEFTDMAKHARALVASNGLSDVVEVVQTAVEDLDIEEGSVDIIISEWMGYFLLRESMLDSLLRARDKFLKPGGLMFPSHATMYWGMAESEYDRSGCQQDYEGSVVQWNEFLEETDKLYGIDMKVLDKAFTREQYEYYILTGAWAELQPQQAVGEGQVVKQLDLHTCTFEDARGLLEPVPFDITVDEPRRASAYVGWFDVNFAGTEENPCKHVVTLGTGPHDEPTHWGQQVFYFPSPFDLQPGDTVSGTVRMVRQEENERLYDVHVESALKRGDRDAAEAAAAATPPPADAMSDGDASAPPPVPAAIAAASAALDTKTLKCKYIMA